MTKYNLQRMLELTYELEGLLEISVRKDELPESMRSMLLAKLDSIRTIMDSESDSVPAPAEERIGKSYNDISDDFKDEDIDEIREDIVDEDNDEIKSVIVDETDDDIENMEVSPTDSVGDDVTKRGGVKESRMIFTLNDRFLYSKELFNNDIDSFDRALTAMASCENYDEAEEYFYSEWGLDPSEPVVEDFLLLVSKYFK